jgi:hypothetical protein
MHVPASCNLFCKRVVERKSFTQSGVLCQSAVCCWLVCAVLSTTVVGGLC